MHQDLLPLVICPDCGGDLALEPYARVEGDHTVGGTYGDWNDVAVKYAAAANESIDAGGTRP